MREKEVRQPDNTEMLPEQLSGIQDVESSDSSARLPEETWENMFNALYSYRFGHIDFLTLLDRWEEMLQIKAPSH